VIEACKVYKSYYLVSIHSKNIQNILWELSNPNSKFTSPICQLSKKIAFHNPLHEYILTNCWHGNRQKQYMIMLDCMIDVLSPLVAVLRESFSSSLLPSKLLCQVVVSSLIQPSPYFLDLYDFIPLLPQLYQPHLPNLPVDGRWGEPYFMFPDRENMNPFLLDGGLDLVDSKESPK